MLRVYLKAIIDLLNEYQSELIYLTRSLPANLPRSGKMFLSMSSLSSDISCGMINPNTPHQFLSPLVQRKIIRNVTVIVPAKFKRSC
jgi:hypothetical protein